MLVKCDAYTNGECFSHGTCGCGTETKLAWAQLSSDYEIEKTQFLLIGSCAESIDNYDKFGKMLSDDEITENISLRMYDARNNQKSLISFDINMPELGLKKEIEKK